MLKCQDYFMIRTSNLPIEYLERFVKQDKDIYEFIISDPDLYDFFKKALIISSKELYKSFKFKPNDTKKYNALKESLLKYFIRSTVRATPYGYLAGVSLGKFNENTQITKSGYILDVQLDNSWVYAVVHMIESNRAICDKLMFKFNPICYVSGKRLINPYFTNSGMAKSKTEIIEENSIRYTPLIKEIKKMTGEFISYEQLQNEINNLYPNVSINLIKETLYTLIDNEILLSNLRIPVYCENHLEHIIKCLEQFAPSSNEVIKLKQIKSKIDQYLKTEKIEDLEMIYALMGEMYKSKNYLIINMGNICPVNTLSFEIKKQIEYLVNIIYSMPIRMNSLNEFKERFLEEYGYNIRVPLLEIIDKNKFDGLKDPFIYQQLQNDKENKFVNIIRDKVFAGILNGESKVCFSKDDFKDIVSSDVIYPKTFDINFKIEKIFDKYQLYLAPCGVSNRGGSMFQRFSNCFDKVELAQYNKIYMKEKEIYNQEYVLVEVREYSNDGRSANVINNRKNVDYYISFGNVESNDKYELKLEEISVGYSSSGKMFLYSEKLNKKIKVVKDNMLNSVFENRIIQLLLFISEENEFFPERRLFAFTNAVDYKYIPKIVFENIVISPKRWNLNTNDLASDSFDEFREKISNSKLKYRLDKIMYLVKADHRLLIDIENKDYLQILYKEYNKNKELIFNGLETDLKNLSLVSDERGRHYMGEYVFSIVSEDIKNMISSERYLGDILDGKERKKVLLDDGWVYFKLYGNKENQNKILSIYLPQLIERLGNPEHFFIRYNDNLGDHLRIRIKFKVIEQASTNMLYITKWAKELQKLNIINNIGFDTYFRENNRYGGNKLIDYFEMVFFKNSNTVEMILKENDLTDIAILEKWYILGITYILQNLASSEEEMLGFIDGICESEKYRKEYRKNNKKYIEYVSSVLENRILSSTEMEKLLNSERQSLINYKLQIDSTNQDLTNKKQNIVLSVVHMYCNRLNGNRYYEEKYLAIVRNTLYHILETKKKKK